jgi:hypothetical protein
VEIGFSGALRSALCRLGSGHAADDMGRIHQRRTGPDLGGKGPILLLLKTESRPRNLAASHRTHSLVRGKKVRDDPRSEMPCWRVDDDSLFSFDFQAGK